MTYNEFEGNLQDRTNLSTRTKHHVTNAVSPQRFHCTSKTSCRLYLQGIGDAMTKSGRGKIVYCLTLFLQGFEVPAPHLHLLVLGFLLPLQGQLPFLWQ